MKKLNQLVLHKAKIMTAPQMKHISGGYNDGGGSGGGTCCFKDRNNGIDCANCGHSRSVAEKMAGLMESNWCCDSCYDGTSGWGAIKCESIYSSSLY